MVNFIQLICRDSLAGISDFQADTPLGQIDFLQGHGAVFPVVFDGIGDQVDHYLSEPQGISRHLDSIIPANIIDDPDAPDPKAPKMVWAHWLLYNIPADCSGLTENIASTQLPAGTLSAAASILAS